MNPMLRPRSNWKGKAASVIAIVWCSIFFPLPATAQKSSTGLFESNEILFLKFSGDTRALFNDRGDNAQYHPLVLSYPNQNNTTTSLTLRAKTRGHFRKDQKNCTFPPLLLTFQNSDKNSTLFRGQGKLKLVTTCREEKYVIREYLVYKLYSLLTPQSFGARLACTTFYDTIRKKEVSFYSILLEEDQQMAKRNGAQVINRKMLLAENTETETFLKMAVFQYMIGNTDWSVPYLHNIRLLAPDSLATPYVVPYDFDYSGIVDAPYAIPPEELALRSVRERRYRGYCLADPRAFDPVIETFNRLKTDFYGVYTNCALLDARYIAATLRYLDQFYESINNSKKRDAAFGYPCKQKVPKVVVKGL